MIASHIWHGQRLWKMDWNENLIANCLDIGRAAVKTRFSNAIMLAVPTETTYFGEIGDIIDHCYIISCRQQIIEKTGIK